MLWFFCSSEIYSSDCFRFICLYVSNENALDAESKTETTFLCTFDKILFCDDLDAYDFTLVIVQFMMCGAAKQKLKLLLIKM